MTRIKFLLLSILILTTTLYIAHINTTLAAERLAHAQQLHQLTLNHQAALTVERKARKQAEQRAAEYEEILTNRARMVEAAQSPTTMPINLPSGLDAATLERSFASIAPDMSGTGEYYIEAERRYGINAWILAAIAHLESGGGTSRIYREKNNVGGLGAYTDSPESAFSFDSRADSIFYLAELLATHYAPGGKYYTGSWTLEGVNVHYASDAAWAAKVGARLGQIMGAAV